MGWLSFATLMAQEVTHDIKGVVTDKRQQPIVGALVTVEGTTISTVTDLDGKFLLREVPVSSKHLVVESIGMETEEWEIGTPIQVKQKHRKLSFVASAGMVMSRYTAFGGSTKWGYEVGLGIETRRSEHWAFRLMFQLANRGTVYEYNKEGFDYKETWNPVMLDMPMYFMRRWKLAPKSNLVFAFGPAFSLGLGGKVKSVTNGKEEEYDIYSKEHDSYYEEDGKYSLLYRFSTGLAYGIGVEYKKWMIGAWGKNMVLIPGNDDSGDVEHNWALTFGLSYRF